MPQLHHVVSLNKLLLDQYQYKWHKNKKSIFLSFLYRLIPSLHRFRFTRWLTRLGVVFYHFGKYFVQNLLHLIGFRPLTQVISRHMKLLLLLLLGQVAWYGLFSHGYYWLIRRIHCYLNPVLYKQRQNLLENIEKSNTYLQWANSAIKLDAFDGYTSWKLTNASEHYDWQRLERFCGILLHLYTKQKSRAMMLFLQAHLCRNFCNILALL